MGAKTESSFFFQSNIPQNVLDSSGTCILRYGRPSIQGSNTLTNIPDTCGGGVITTFLPRKLRTSTLKRPFVTPPTLSWWITYVLMVGHPVGNDTAKVSHLRFFFLFLTVTQGVIRTATRMNYNDHTRWFGAGQSPSTSITSTSSRHKGEEEREIHGGSLVARTGRLC